MQKILGKFQFKFLLQILVERKRNPYQYQTKFLKATFDRRGKSADIQQ